MQGNGGGGKISVQAFRGGQHFSAQRFEGLPSRYWYPYPDVGDHIRCNTTAFADVPNVTGHYRMMCKQYSVLQTLLSRLQVNLQVNGIDGY